MDLLAFARDLFAAPQMTEQQAADRFRQNATAATSAQTDLAAANQTIATLRSQVGDLTARAVKPLDDEVRAERVIRVTERAESLTTRAGIAPADARALLGDVAGLKFDADGKVDVAASKVDDVMLARAPGATDCRAAVILGRLATMKFVPPGGRDAAFADKRRDVPGGNAQQGQASATDRQAELLAEQLKGYGIPAKKG